jgi:transposase
MPKGVILNARGGVDDAAWALMRYMRAERKTHAQIAAVLNIARSTVAYNIDLAQPSKRARGGSAQPSSALKKRRQLVLRLAKKQFTRTQKISDKKKRGPKPQQRIVIVRPFNSPALIVRELRRAHNITVSESTVRRDLLHADYKVYVRPKGPQMRAPDARLRLEFAIKHAKSAMLKNLAFSDEKYFDSNDSGQRFRWEPATKHRKRGEGPSTEPRRADPMGQDRWACKVQVWGCIGVGFRKLIFLGRHQRLTSDSYVADVLRPTLAALKKKKCVLMQDGARCHTARKTLKFLKDRRASVLENWPARSPDLNPIEQVWGFLSRTVAARGPTDDEELKEFVRAEWDAIPQSTLDGMVLGFRDRLKKVIERNGRTL